MSQKLGIKNHVSTKSFTIIHKYKYLERPNYFLQFHTSIVNDLLILFYNFQLGLGPIQHLKISFYYETQHLSYTKFQLYNLTLFITSLVTIGTIVMLLMELNETKCKISSYAIIREFTMFFIYKIQSSINQHIPN